MSVTYLAQLLFGLRQLLCQDLLHALLLLDEEGPDDARAHAARTARASVGAAHPLLTVLQPHKRALERRLSSPRLRYSMGRKRGTPMMAFLPQDASCELRPEVNGQARRSHRSGAPWPSW